MAKMKKMMRKIRSFFAITALSIMPVLAHASCNSAANWSETPGGETKVFIGYEPKEKNLLNGITDGYQDSTRFGLMPSQIEKKSAGTPFFADGVTPVSYYEDDGTGGWRLCRVEQWWPPDAKDDSTRQVLRTVTPRYMSKNPVLSNLPTGVMAYSAKLIFYDKKGRVQRIMDGRFTHPEQPAVTSVCYFYDDKDRVLLAVSPSVTKTCPSTEPDRRDRWKRYRYADYEGKVIPLLVQAHNPNDDGSWNDDIRKFRTGPTPDGVWGAAKVDSVKGVTVIYGSNVGKKDNDSANTVVNEFGHWNGATYTFTKPPVPETVIEIPEQIYNYERRRETNLDGAAKLYELFPSKSNISRDRYYMLSSLVVRHEQLDIKGKVVRVITIKDWRQPYPGPHPDVDDKRLSRFNLKAFAHRIYHRVYDFDGQGQAKLVAISWEKGGRGREKMPIDMVDLAYGTPDGKEKWTQSEFEKKFNTSANANQVFPDHVR
jgi:hypothetical protein